MKLTLDKSLIAPLVISLTSLIIGSMFFMSSWEYSEQWHEVLFAAYGVLSLSLFIAFRFKYKQIMIFLIMSMIAILFYSNLKFDWRKEYIVASKSGVYFTMDPYIERYPLFEEHIFSWALDVPHWVDFNDECVAPALKRQGVSRTCKSVQLIENKYGFNVEDLINTHYRHMKSTAKSLESGRIKTKGHLLGCIKEKKCAAIPLLPASVDVENFDTKSNDYITIRTQFWSLINDDEISPENCEFMTLCRAMRNIGTIAIKKPNNDI
jgi:hypothetical protein